MISQFSQVAAIGRNDPGNNHILGSTFATVICSNFSIRVINTTDHEPLQPIREAFSFQLDKRSSVTINFIEKSAGNFVHFYGKYNAEVMLYVKIAYAAAFRPQ